MTEGEALCRASAVAAADKKAGNIVVLDLRSIRELIRERFGRKPISEDGFPASQWIILDYGDVIVHLFQGEKREFYALESLWSDAKSVTLQV